MCTLRIARLALFCGLLVTGRAGAELLHWQTDLSGTWVDATDGEPLNLAGEDVASITATVGNDVFAPGEWKVGNNGAVGFGPSDLLPPVTEPIPTEQIFQGQQALAPFADDIGNDIGNIYHKKVPVPGRGEALVIEWFNKQFEGHPDTCTFEIQVFSDPGPNHVYAQFLYLDIQQAWPNGGEIATIGYQDGGAGFNDAQWSYHVAGAVWDGMVLSLVPEPASVALLLPFVLLRPRARKT